MEQARVLCFADRDCHKRYKMGAVLVNKNRVLSMGFNQSKTHTRAAEYHTCTLHAEIACLIGVSKEKLRGATMYVYRVNRTGKPGISKPCKLCEEILRDAGLRDVYYLNREPEIERMKF